jgi:hypothetical protein
MHNVAVDTPLPCRTAEPVQGYSKTIQRWYSICSPASSANRSLWNLWVNSAATPTRAWGRPTWSSTCLMLYTQRCIKHTTSAVYRRRMVACSRLLSIPCKVCTLLLAYPLPPQHLLSANRLANDAAELAPRQKLSLYAQRCSSHTISAPHNQRTIA